MADSSMVSRRSCSALLLVLWTLAIAWLSLTPSPPSLNSPLIGWDKFQHAGAYAVLTLLGGLSFGGTRRSFATAFAGAVVYGGLIELLQGQCTVNRTADWFDLLANLTGAGVAALLGARLFSRR